MKDVKKQNLPTKICAVCNRPFAWRKKWAQIWEEVRYCGEKCRRQNKKTRICQSLTEKTLTNDK